MFFCFTMTSIMSVWFKLQLESLKRTLELSQEESRELDRKFRQEMELISASLRREQEETKEVFEFQIETLFRKFRNVEMSTTTPGSMDAAAADRYNRY